MATKSFWFCISEDYRSGPKIYTYDDCIDDDDIIIFNRNFELPLEGKIRMYLCNDAYDTETPVWYRELEKDADHKSIYLKMFSQIHDCIPFKVTGHNCAYKEEGHYPNIPAEIKKMTDGLTEQELEDINNNYEDRFFVFTIDSDGTNISADLLVPIC